MLSHHFLHAFQLKSSHLHLWLSFYLLNYIYLPTFLPFEFCISISLFAHIYSPCLLRSWRSWGGPDEYFLDVRVRTRSESLFGDFQSP
ncbi:hypothetical protein BDZ91DRAFT_731317 [Kalaharituber pfeilii]|nr:hypothetical protein BDZ91DRAFT_731317 [Kalaharituber pfeilii]